MRPEWSIATVQGILENDFYIGTLRQGKYTRKKINGADVKKDESEHLVFENNHEAIVDFRAFAIAKRQMEKRTTDNYRGVKKYGNDYSGFSLKTLMQRRRPICHKPPPISIIAHPILRIEIAANNRY